MTGKIAEISPERSKEVDEWVNDTIKPIHNVESDFAKLLRKKNVVELDENSEGEQTAFKHLLNPMQRREDYVVVKYYLDSNDEFTMLVQINHKGVTKVKDAHDKLFHVAFLKALTIAVSLFEDYFGSKTTQYKHLFKFFEAYRTWVNVNALSIKQHELPGITEDLPQSLPVITDELPEVKEVNYNELPYDEKVKHICHAMNPNYPELIDNLDWLNRDNMRIFPFEHFTNFEVKEMKMVCDGCGEPFDGNGYYDTAYFVHHAPTELKLYHSLRHCYPGYLTNPIDYHDQLHGYLLPVKFPEKFIQSKVHRFVWSYLKSSAYKLNAFVPDGFKTIEECKKAIDNLDGDGGGSSIDNGVGRHKGMKLEWSKGFTSPKPEITLKPSDTLKIVNEILAACEPQSPLIDYVVLDAPTPKKELKEAETENCSAGSVPLWKFTAETAMEIYAKAIGEDNAEQVLKPFLEHSKNDEGITFNFPKDVKVCCTYCDDPIPYKPNTSNSWLVSNQSDLFYLYCIKCAEKRYIPFDHTAVRLELESAAQKTNELAAPGNNFRERYNNKKMRNRLIKQLEEMPADRRAYLIESIQKHFTTTI